MAAQARARQPQDVRIAGTGEHVNADNVLGEIEQKETIIRHARCPVPAWEILATTTD